MKTKTIIAVLPFMFAFTNYGGKDKYTLDKDKRDKVKIIALASIYGESEGGIIYKGGSEFAGVDNQPYLDYLEQQIAARFTGTAITAVSPEKSKAEFGNMMEFGFALNQVMGKPAPTEKDIALAKKNIAMLRQWDSRGNLHPSKATFSEGKGLDGTKEISSANTVAPSRSAHMDKKGSSPSMDRHGKPTFSETFLKTDGVLAQKSNADGFVLVRLETEFGDDSAHYKGVFYNTAPYNFNPLGGLFKKGNGSVTAHAQLDFFVYNNAGELVYQDVVTI